MKVSVDTDKAAWEKMVTEQQLSGVQLYAGGWDTKITKDFLINGIPRFLLIDREGNIVNANAKRPSGGLREVLAGLEGIES